MSEDKKNGRGPAPDEQTKLKLCALTGGRCYFCNKFLFTDNISLKDTNNSNLAHIVASSPKGPRGNKDSHKLSDKIENLMLMCQEHHHLIDQDYNTYTVELLKDLKAKRERQYALFSHAQEITETYCVIFRSPIKGKDMPNYSIQKMVMAFLLKKIPADSDGIDLSLTKLGDYNSKDYWNKADKEIEDLFNTKIIRKIERVPEAHFSVFPLAPIPMIIKLGYLFSDKIHNEVYQRFRESDSWEWKCENETNSFEIEKEELAQEGEIALVFDLTAKIQTERISTNTILKKIYRLSAENKGVDCISSKKDLYNFGQKYLKICDLIKNENPTVKTINVYCAMPVPAAFEIGRRFMKGVFPKMIIYDDNNGFFKTLMIGE